MARPRAPSPKAMMMMRPGTPNKNRSASSRFPARPRATVAEGDGAKKKEQFTRGVHTHTASAS